MNENRLASRCLLLVGLVLAFTCLTGCGRIKELLRDDERAVLEKAARRVLDDVRDELPEDGAVVGSGGNEDVPELGGDGATGGDDGTGGDGATGGGSGEAVPADFAGVKWLHTDVSSWPETTKLNVSVSGSSVNLNFDKAKVWPAGDAVGKRLMGNPWIFVRRDGVWYAATWEWLRPGQTSKSRRAVAGDHIKRAPLNDFQPKSGETYGFMVSGLARGGERNVAERSNVVMVRWP